MKKQLENKLIHLIKEIHAMRETYKSEIEQSDCEMDLDAGTVSLEDALHALQEEAEEDNGGESWDKHCAFEGRMENFI